MTLPFRLLAITPPRGDIDPAVVHSWSAAAAVGLAVLLREPGTPPQDLVHPDHRLAALRRACAQAQVPCLLSVEPTPAEGLSAAVRTPGVVGVQLRGDPSVAQIEGMRALLPSDYRIGRSCHGTPPPLGDRVDYSVLAPIFAPHTAGPGPRKLPVGLEPLRALCAVDAHVFALGGLDGARGEACLRAGAFGLAGIRSFFGGSRQVADNVARWVDALTRPADDVAPPP